MLTPLKRSTRVLRANPTDLPAVLRGPHRPDLLREECLSDILAATARRRPQHPALIWGQRTITYGELNAAADRIGAALANSGAAPGQVLGLLLPRGADLLLAQAGITRSGAAWLPFDAETPLERVKTCLQSAHASGLVTCRAWLPRLADLPLPVWPVEDLLCSSNHESAPSSLSLPGAGTACPRTPAPLPPPDLIQPVTSNLQPVTPSACRSGRSVTPSDPAYVIYTSGSTGQPKGILISHRSICHFLRSENEMLGICETDRVYQGFSVAFDMSFEEIWISYLVGATLWLAPPSLVGDPDSLAKTLTDQRITVLHAVPTLMGLLNDPVPTVRLINLGGEACPPALAERLARPGRRLFNTYGPTETSVSASLAELHPGQPVTIGLPLPNYGLLLVDEDLRPLPAGAIGELCIFGPGLALGYLGRPDLTAERFVPNPLAATPDESLMYRTGDLARIDPGGPVHCLGRADRQVKIRGFRIELDEISSLLAAQPNVAAATVVVRPLGELEHLVAFVAPSPDQKLSPAALRHSLSPLLPPYMVPAHFEVLPEMPRLTSGKINLKLLQSLPLRISQPNAGEHQQPQNEEQAALHAALARLFPNCALQSEADFFDDLGGHSLLAARLVSHLRRDSRYAALSVQDIYRERRLAGITQVMARLRQQTHRPAAPARAEVPWRRRFLCGLAQATVIPFFVLFHMADWLAPFFVYHYFTGSDGDSIPRAVLYSLTTFVVALVLKFGVAILGKSLAARHLPAGRYPLWGVTYFRWWLAQRFCELPDLFLLAATPWMPLYFRALGARIGPDVLIDTITVGAPELLTIEAGVSIGTFVNIENARAEGGQLILGPVQLKRDSVVDSYSVLEDHTTLGEHSRLGGQSALSAGRQIPDGESWEGAPARPAQPAHEPLPPRPSISFLRRWALALLFAATGIAVAILFFLPTFPAFMLIDWVDTRTWNLFESEHGPLTAFGLFFLLATPASALFVGLTIMLTAGLHRLLPRQAAGLYSIHSLAFWRKKLTTLVLDSSLSVLHGLYASVFAPTWLRCLGVTVGRHAEVSTATGMVPELLRLGDDSFIADGVLLGDEEQRGGWMVLKPTQIGHRSFVGNGAYVPDGTCVPDDVLIGVQTRTPKNKQLKSGQTWMGSPPILLPARECSTGFPDSLTFRPSLWRRLGRGFVEGLRIVLPLALVIATGYLIIALVMPLAEEDGWGLQVALALSVAGCLYGFASFLFVVALKWLLVGRYRPRAAPMWTPFVWLSEAVTNLYESLAVPNFLDLLRGTPMLPWALRLLGARLGRGIYLDTTDLTEFDCVHIGDEAELNSWSGPQTHLFEDRVMKIGNVQLGARVTIGARSTILYDTSVGDGTQLGPLTLVAKGEHLPPASRWEGTPATPALKPEITARTT